MASPARPAGDSGWPWAPEVRGLDACIDVTGDGIG